MNTLNRILVIFGALVLLLIIGTIVLVSTHMITPQQLLPSPWDHTLTPFTQMESSTWWGVLAIGTGVSLVSLLLLLIELRPWSHTESRLVVKKDDLGEVTAALTSIQELASRETGHIEGVMESSTQVRESPDGIHLDCRLSVDPATSIADLGHHVQERLKSSVEHYLGKAVAGVHITAQVAPLGKKHNRKPSRVR
ncbi:alkaline shock response membrane anchor protein AmaP [Nitrospira sp. M1]